MSDNTFKVTSCEVCDNSNLYTVLNLGNHPMCDDLVNVTENRQCKEYPIEILFCEKCFTGHQKYQILGRHIHREKPFFCANSR